MTSITPPKQSKHFAAIAEIQLKHTRSKLTLVDIDITAARQETKESEMLKKTIIAAALASAAMLAMAGSASAAGAKTLSSPAAKHTSHAAPKAFRIAGKRRFRHGRHFQRHWDTRPYRSCHSFKRKARWTGKRYWWKRYYACRSHSYYAY